MHQAERSIQIVGKNNLQNSLLAAYLEDAVGASCFCRASLEGVTQKKDPEAGEQLVLIDCFTLPRDEIASLVESERLKRLTGELLTLFNLRADLSIEQTAIRCGIRGFFYLEDSLLTLVKGVTALFNDDYWVSRKLLVDFFSTPNHTANLVSHFPGLTLRESELVGLLVRGLSNQSIADLLFISIPTVKSHLSSIYRKINVSNRLQAVCWAEKAGCTSRP
jgi:LuxR family transcriptional regulator, positive regulator of biofilm formation